MADMLLTFHGYRLNRPDDDNEIRALFLFTLMPEADVKAGLQPNHTQAFWTEVRLSRDLASRGRWASLSEKEKVVAMFKFAQDRIQESGRKLREAPMFWTATSPYRDGPAWSLADCKFPAPHSVSVKTSALAGSPTLESRKAAGLLA